MHVSVETVSPLGRKIIISLPAETIEPEIEKRLQKLTQTAQIKGFRKGKAPFKLIKNNYGSSVRYEIIDEKMKDSLTKALEQENLTPASIPQVDIISIDEGKPFEYSATFEIFPKIELKELNGVTLEKIIPTITETDIDETLAAIRKQHIQWHPTERAAQLGDKVIIDFEGFKEDNTPLERGSLKDAEIILGDKKFVPGFEENLVDTKPGEEKTFTITFPENYSSKDIAGKPVTFKTHINSVFEPKLPEIDDEFAKKLEIKEGTVEALKNEIRTTLQREGERRATNKLKSDAFQKLAELNPIPLPEYTVEKMANTLRDDFMDNLSREWKSKGRFEFPSTVFKPRAESQVRLGLLLRELIQKYKLEADDQKIWSKIEQISESYSNPSQAATSLYNDKSRLNQIEEAILEDQALEKLLENTNVVEKPMGYHDIIKLDSKDHDHEEEGHVHDEHCQHGDHDH